VVWEGLTKADLSSFINGPYPDAPVLFNSTNVAEQFKRIRKCSAGPDGLSGKLLNAASEVLIPAFVRIFNYCVKASFRPDEWSSANITAIPKVTNPSLPVDYRPIAITSAACKMFERILSKYIIDHTKTIWSTNKQYGFLPNRCTMDAIIQVVNDWGSAKDVGKEVLAIFFDFAKAFDLVDHVILLNKLKSLLPPWLVSLIAAYLSSRRQRVSMYNIDTEWRQVLAGVIQGSVLGPVLFLLFISDINGYFPDGVVLQKYADDILTYIIGRCPPSLPQAIVDGIQRWCLDNNMRLNSSKCKLLAINIASPPPIVLHNQLLEYVTVYKYLGIELNVNLNSDMQWHRVRTLICTLPYLLKQLKLVGWSQSMLISAYRAYGLSHLVYSAPILESTSKSAKNDMQLFQNRILRIAGLTQEEATARYNIIPVHDRLDQICNRVIVKIISDSDHPITASLPRNNRSSRDFDFIIPRAKSTAYNDSFLLKYLRILRDNAPRTI
jgi:hypothetical protein